MMDLLKLYDSISMLSEDESASETERKLARRLLSKLKRIDKQDAESWSSIKDRAEVRLNDEDLNEDASFKIRSVIANSMQDMLAFLWYDVGNKLHVSGDKNTVLVIEAAFNYAIGLCEGLDSKKQVAVFSRVFELVKKDCSSRKAVISRKVKDKLENDFLQDMECQIQYARVYDVSKRSQNFADKIVDEDAI